MRDLPRFRFVARAVGGVTTPEWHFPTSVSYLIAYDSVYNDWKAYDPATGVEQVFDGAITAEAATAMWASARHPSGFVRRRDNRISLVTGAGALTWDADVSGFPQIGNGGGGMISVDDTGNAYAAFENTSNSINGTTVTVKRFSVVDGSEDWSVTVSVAGLPFDSGTQASCGWANGIVYVLARQKVFALRDSDGVELGASLITQVAVNSARSSRVGVAAGGKFYALWYERDTSTNEYATYVTSFAWSGGILVEGTAILVVASSTAGFIDQWVTAGTSVSDAAYFVGEYYHPISGWAYPYLVRVNVPGETLAYQRSDERVTNADEYYLSVAADAARVYCGFFSQRVGEVGVRAHDAVSGVPGDGYYVLSDTGALRIALTGASS